MLGKTNILKFPSGMVVPVDDSGLTIEDDAGNTFNVSSVIQGKTLQELVYKGTWSPSNPVPAVDTVHFGYDHTGGDLISTAGGIILSFDMDAVYIGDAYKTGSIYSGTKDISSIWVTEKQATKVNSLLISGGTVNVNIGWGDTAVEASSTKETISSGATERVYVTGNHIGWQGSTGTAVIEQSISRV